MSARENLTILLEGGVSVVIYRAHVEGRAMTRRRAVLSVVRKLEAEVRELKEEAARLLEKEGEKDDELDR